MVMLARTDIESRTVTLPGGRMVSPGEFIGAALASIEIGTFPRRVGSWFDWSLTGVTALLALWIRKWKPRATVIVTVAALGLCALGAWWVFHSEQLLLPALLPLGLATWVLLLRLVARRIEKIIAF
jgi:hypothetical protein